MISHYLILSYDQPLLLINGPPPDLPMPGSAPDYVDSCHGVNMITALRVLLLLLYCRRYYYYYYYYYYYHYYYYHYHYYRYYLAEIVKIVTDPEMTVSVERSGTERRNTSDKVVVDDQMTDPLLSTIQYTTV